MKFTKKDVRAATQYDKNGHGMEIKIPAKLPEKKDADEIVNFCLKPAPQEKKKDITIPIIEQIKIIGISAGFFDRDDIINAPLNTPQISSKIFIFYFYHRNNKDYTLNRFSGTFSQKKNYFCENFAKKIT